MKKYSSLPKPDFPKKITESEKPKVSQAIKYTAKQSKPIKDVNEGVVKDFVKKVTGTLFNKKFSISTERANSYKFMFAKALIDSLDLLKFRTSFNKFVYDYKGILDNVQKDLRGMIETEYKNQTERDFRYSTILNIQDSYDKNTILLDELYNTVQYIEYYIKANAEKYFEKRYPTNKLSKNSEKNRELLEKFKADLDLIFEPTNKSYIFGSEKKRNKNQLEIIGIKIIENFKKRGFDFENMVIKYDEKTYSSDYEKAVQDREEEKIPDVVHIDKDVDSTFKKAEPEEHKIVKDEPKKEETPEPKKETPKEEKPVKETPKEEKPTSSTYLLPDGDMGMVFDLLRKKFKDIVIPKNPNIRKKVYNLVIQPMSVRILEQKPDTKLTYKKVYDVLIDDLNVKRTEELLKRIEANKDII